MKLKELPRLHREAVDAAIKGESVMYVLPTYRETTEEFRQLARAVKDSPCVERVYLSSGNQRITFTSGGVIYFTATSRNGGRGFSPDLLILCAPIGNVMIPAKRVLHG